MGKGNTTRDFYMDYEKDPLSSTPTYNFRVHRSTTINNSDEWFDLRLIQFDTDTFLIDWIGHNYKPWYSGMGIPDALIPRACNLLNVTICSSTNSPSHKTSKDKYRTVDAEKMWKRLVEKGLATYDSSKDRYFSVRHRCPIISIILSAIRMKCPRKRR